MTFHAQYSASNHSSNFRFNSLFDSLFNQAFKRASVNLPRLFCLFLFISALAGCSVTPGEQYQSITVKDAAQAKAWELQGKIAVKSSSEKFSTNLYWFHLPQENQLTLTTVLGTTVLKLSAKPGLAKLEVDGKEFVDANAQDLLEAVSGWSIPIDSLPLWITGQVGPNDKVTSLDPQGRIKTLSSPSAEEDWQVSFLSWQQQSGALMPKQIRVERAGMQVKIQINQWQALNY
jgi:outer membrane lipoprotein LolB